MEKLKNKLIDLVIKQKNGIEAAKLQTSLSIENETFDTLVDELLEENLLWIRKDGKLTTLENEGLKIGIVNMNPKGFAFLAIEDEEDVFIPKNDLKTAMHKDEVIILVKEGTKGKKREGKVIKVTKRNTDVITGVFEMKKNVGIVSSTDKKIQAIVHIEPEKTLSAVDGHIVLAKITDRRSGNLYGEVLKIIGHKNDPGVDILTIISERGLSTEFPEEVLEEVARINEDISEKERAKRVDLTDEIIITIDGEDAKDLDDAISIDVLNNGNYKLGVHIADVSSYVKEGTYLDKEAFSRGTSVYLVDRVIPMLPHKLSNGVCSLNPRVERLTLTCEMEITNEGQVVRHEIFESIIKTTERMTYSNVNLILNDKDETLRERYQTILPLLETGEELAKALRGMRRRRGSIDFDLKEAKILVDEDCKPIDITYRDRSTGEKMIEEFMLIANETVATRFETSELPFIYRVHQKPDIRAMKDFAGFVESYGYQLNKKKHVRSKDLQKLIEDIKGKKEETAISKIMLRTMQQARYDSENLEHFGLASNCYTHFTSPIRRYPDLIVHRTIRDLLIEKNPIKQPEDYIEKLTLIAMNSSEKERQAMDAERDTVELKKAEYMLKEVGNVFPGLITSVTKFGFFVELENTIEGLVHINTLGGEYEYDEKKYRLTNINNHNTYTIGDEVKVKVLKVNLDERSIDFDLVSRKKGKVIKKETRKRRFDRLYEE